MTSAMNLVDSSGWIEYFANGPLAEPYSEYLGKSEELITPTIVLYEVYKKLKGAIDEEHALLAASQMEKTRIVPLTESIAYQAADLSLIHKIPMADAIVYATALSHNARVITSDADFKNLPKVLFLNPVEE